VLQVMFAERVWKHHWFKVHVMNDMTVARAWMVRANGFIRVVTIFRRVHSPAQGLFIIQEPIRRGLLECHTHERLWECSIDRKNGQFNSIDSKTQSFKSSNKA
jgi:hypothetical protein